MNPNFKDWFLQQENKVELIKNHTLELNRLHKKSKKSSEAFHNFKGSRTGIRGGKHSTIWARQSNDFDNYQRCLEELKLMVNLL